MHKSQSLFLSETALHVSGVTITHRQEHKITVTTASGNRYTVLLSVAIVEESELVCNRYFAWRPMYIYKSFCLSSKVTDAWDESYRKSTHFMLNNSPPPRISCHLWGNVEKHGRGRQATDDIIQCTPFASWITKATDTHSEYVILIAFPRPKVATHTSIACLVSLHTQRPVEILTVRR
jgi:hypothetical protein